MTEPDPSLPMTPSTMASARFRKRAWRRPPLIWIIPIVAAAIGVLLFINLLAQRGPEITVIFRTAEGLSPGKTSVRYKSVNIGLVKSVRLASNRAYVIATIELTSDADSFLARDTRFWVVRPRLAASGISGLETLLSGAYIGVDAGKSETRARHFTGLEQPPAVTSEASGKQFVLRADDLGSLDIGSPVFYRRVQVGQIVAYQLDPRGKGISLRIFVNQPYDKLITADTRFWHASGVDIRLDSGGVKLNTQALAAVLLGGVSFLAPPDSRLSAGAHENTEFMLADDQAEAMKAIDGLSPELVVLNFDQSVRGLSPGAPLDFRGIVVGQVRSIGVEYLRDKKVFRFPVVVEIYPARVGLDQHELKDKKRARELAETMNKRGMRAQLRTGNLLTGQLYVAFDFFPKAPPVNINIDGPLPEIATIPGALDEIQGKLADIVNKLDKVPFEQIGQDLRTSMASLNKMLNSADKLATQLNGDVLPEVGSVLKEVRATLQSANTTLDPSAPLQQDTRRMLQEMTRAAVSLRTLTDYLELHPEALIRGKPGTDNP